MMSNAPAVIGAADGSRRRHRTRVVKNVPLETAGLRSRHYHPAAKG